MSAFTFAVHTDVSHYSLESLFTDFEQAVKERATFPASLKRTGGDPPPEYRHVVDLFLAKQFLLEKKLRASGVSVRANTTYEKYCKCVWRLYAPLDTQDVALMPAMVRSHRATMLAKAAKLALTTVTK